MAGLLELVLPQRCLVCGERGEQLCASCSDGLTRLRPPLCDRCGAPTAWPVARCAECSGRRLAFASARAAVAYDAAAARVVAGWKEGGLRRLGDAAAAVVAGAVPPLRVDLLVPVPPDPDRRLERGHHPAGALASALGRHWGLPVAAPLVRPRAGPRQRGLALRERRRNVAGAFSPRARVPPRVGLVDDVYTSGTTATAAASALRHAGAQRVEVITFARAIRRS